MNEQLDSTPKSNFEASVECFSHLNVKGDINVEKRELIPNLIMRSVMIAICIALFCYATFMIGTNIATSNEASEFYDDLRTDGLASAVKHSPSLLEPASMLTFQEMLNSNGEYLNYIGGIDSMDDMERRSNCYRNFMNQVSKYPDTYAWIYVDYTQIDYPVMKGEYTDYYLYRNFKGEDSNEGSITAKSDMSDVYTENRNNVFYGHCMKNGLMFRTLKTFMESANRHTLAKTMDIEVYTEDGLYIYKVLSGYRDDSQFFSKTRFNNDTEYFEFLTKVAEYNDLSVRPDYDQNSRICTLITCSNVSSNQDERYVLHGILKTFVPASQL